jgi:hypothetical protein
MYLVIPKTPLGTDEAGIFAQATSMSTIAKVALAIAAGAVLWRLFEGWRALPMQRNMLAPWADIGPMFALSQALGPAFGLTHLL